MDIQNSFGKRLATYIVPFLSVLLVGTVIGLQFGVQTDGTSVLVTYSSEQPESSEVSNTQTHELLESDAADEESNTLQSQFADQPKKYASSRDTPSKNVSSKGTTSKKAPSSSSVSSSSTQSDGAQAPPIDDSNLPYNTQGNTSGNILNGGLAASQGSWIYYVNTKDGSTLYRMKADGSSEQQLTEFSVSSINVLGEWVYAQVVNNTQVVAKVKTDGTSYRYIRLNSFNLCVSEDAIVSADATERSCIYRTNHDYRTKYYLYEEYAAAQLTMYNQSIYFVNQNDDDQLYAMDAFGENMRRVGDQSISGYGFGDGDVFLCIDNKLYRQSDPSQAIGSHSVGCFNISGQTIYYANLDAGGQLYAMNLDGGNNRKLDSASVSQICIAGNWLFYNSNGVVQRIKL